MKAKGRFSVSMDYLKELLDIPEDVRIQKVSYDEAFGVLTLIGFSPEAIEGNTYPYTISSRMPDRTYEEDLYDGREITRIERNESRTCDG